MAINNKIIVKNTVVMYIRMVVTIIIGLFTVRVVLRTLGVDDFGLYNVVSGIVVMLSFLSNTLATTTQRFLSYELGGLGNNKIKHIFGTSIILYLLLCLFVLVLAETIGLWYVNAEMNIPIGRMVTANWIYQFSVISFIFTILSAPYNACIISHEKMDVYAYISIIDAILKLSLVYLLTIFMGDKLLLYGLFLMILSVAEYFFYRIYCRKNFEESHYILDFKMNSLKEFGAFAGWNMWGAISNVFMGQGVNLLLNAFFNVVINAARGLAYQVDRAINSLVQNFYTAIRPQIVKNYATEEYDDMYKLVFMSTRLGYYLMLVISLVFILNMDMILSLWLGEYPEETVLFAKLVIISNLIIVAAQPFSMVITASGEISKYQIISGLINISVLPCSWFLIKHTADYNIPFYVMIVTSALSSIWTIWQSYKTCAFNIIDFLNICLKMLIITIFVSVLAIFLRLYTNDDILGLITMVISIFVLSFMSIWAIDLNQTERAQMLKFIKNIKSKI